MLQNFTANRQFVNFLDTIDSDDSDDDVSSVLFVQTVSIQPKKERTLNVVPNFALSNRPNPLSLRCTAFSVRLSPICLCGCGQEVGYCESRILYHMDLYIFANLVFSVSQVTTCISRKIYWLRAIFTVV